MKPLLAYPCIYFAVHVFSIINRCVFSEDSFNYFTKSRVSYMYYHECDGMFRIQNAASDDPVFALVLLHAMTVPLNGLYR